MNKVARYTTASMTLLFLLGLLVATPGAVLPHWSAEFGVHGEVAWFFNLQLLGLLLGVAYASRQRRRQPLLPLSALALGGAYLLMALAPSFSWIVAAALVAGAAQGVLNIQSNGMVGDLHPQRRVVMLNRANAAFGLGAVSAPLLVNLLPWRGAFVVVAVAYALAAVLCWGAPQALSVSGAFDLKKSLAALPLLLAVGLYVATESSLSAWSGVYLAALGYSLRLAGLLLSAYWLLITLSRLSVAAWVAGAPLQRLRLLSLGSLAVLLAVVFPPLAPAFPLAAVFFGPIFGTSFAYVQSVFGLETTAGMFYTTAIGSTAGPALFALVGNPRYLPWGFLLLAALLAASLQLAVLRSRKT